MNEQDYRKIVGWLTCVVNANTYEDRKVFATPIEVFLKSYVTSAQAVPAASVVPADPVGVRSMAEGSCNDADHRPDNRETECNSISALESTRVATNGAYIACREKALNYLLNKYFRIAKGTYDVPFLGSTAWSTVNELIDLKRYGYTENALLRALSRRLLGRSKYSEVPKEGSFLYNTGLTLTKTKNFGDYVKFFIEEIKA